MTKHPHSGTSRKKQMLSSLACPLPLILRNLKTHEQHWTASNGSIIKLKRGRYTMVTNTTNATLLQFPLPPTWLTGISSPQSKVVKYLWAPRSHYDLSMITSALCTRKVKKNALPQVVLVWQNVADYSIHKMNINKATVRKKHAFDTTVISRSKMTTASELWPTLLRRVVMSAVPWKEQTASGYHCKDMTRVHQSEVSLTQKW